MLSGNDGGHVVTGPRKVGLEGAVLAADRSGDVCTGGVPDHDLDSGHGDVLTVGIAISECAVDPFAPALGTGHRSTESQKQRKHDEDY